MESKEKAIGVFDSGLGGISVLKELQKQMPHENFLYYGDCAFAPYGVKSKEEITKRCFHIMEYFVQADVKAVVIACNTATSACVDQLREAYPSIIIIGMEPALKLAAKDGKGQTIVVMATEFTLKEKKFEHLMKGYEVDHTIIKLACPKLVTLIEEHQFHNQKQIEQQLHSYLDAYVSQHVDSIVLGCTHFVFYRKWIHKIAKNVHLVDGNDGTTRHLKALLIEKGQLRIQGQGSLQLEVSIHDTLHQTLAEELLAIEIDSVITGM